MSAYQVCSRGSILSTFQGIRPELILPPFFPKLDEEDGDTCATSVAEGLAQDVIVEPKFDPYFLEDKVERKPPTIYCSALQHLCEEGLQMLWGLSFVTDDILSLFDSNFQNPEKAKAAQHFKEDVCSDVLQGLRHHRELLIFWECALGNDESEDLMEAETKLSSATWQLAKLFIQHSQTVDIFKSLGGRQSGAVKYFRKIFQKFRMLMLRRLGISLEQEESLANYRKEMYRRETKAMKDHHALEQQLEIERADRAQQYAQYQEVEKKIQNDKDQSNAQTLALEQQLKADCDALEEQEYAIYNTEATRLKEQNTTMSDQLVKMQNDNRDKELSLRGKKSQSVEEVEALLEEYEQAIVTRKAELDALCAEHQDMKARINTYRGFFDEEARVAFVKAEAERIAWEKICDRFLTRKRYYHAARKIQRSWRAHLAYEVKKKKNEGKGKKKGKKGKKGGKKKEVDVVDLMPKRAVPKKGKKKGKK